MRLPGQVALVTGGARGAGRGIAVALAEAGCDVAVADLLDAADIAEAAEETLELVRATGRRATAVGCDVRDESALADAVARVEADIGQIDHLVVNAGVLDSGDIEDMSPERWQRVVDVNLTGSWLTCRAVVPAMKLRQGGTITVISSVAAARGGAQYTAYCATKAGALGLVRALSHELAPFQIRVNAILPGYLATDMWYRSILGGDGENDAAARAAFDAVVQDAVPLGRPQTARDLGQAVVYLASAPNVTGAELVVDGGRLAGP